jgi:hypothetical protein
MFVREASLLATLDVVANVALLVIRKSRKLGCRVVRCRNIFLATMSEWRKRLLA